MESIKTVGGDIFRIIDEIKRRLNRNQKKFELIDHWGAYACAKENGYIFTSDAKVALLLRAAIAAMQGLKNDKNDPDVKRCYQDLWNRIPPVIRDNIDNSVKLKSIQQQLLNGNIKSNDFIVDEAILTASVESVIATPRFCRGSRSTGIQCNYKF